MALPKVALPTSSIEIGGERVEFHSLTRHQALELHSYQGREDEAEDFIVSCATDVSLDEAREWRNSVDMNTASPLVDAIITLSGLTEQEKPKAKA